MISIPPELAEKWCQSTWVGTRPASPLRAVSVDSRKITAGCLYFALPGARSDGHDFLADITAAGAYAVVRSDFPRARLPAGGGFLPVENVAAALARVAAGARTLLSACVVGIGGSVGKTTTKELVADVLATLGKTSRTAGNFNNEIGLPLSLLDVDADCKFAVLEAGISHPGEMAFLRDIMRPAVAVMTTIGPVHIEHFPSVRAIAEEKATLLEKLPPTGFAVLHRDDDFFDLLRSRSSAPVVSCSLKDASADYRGELLPHGGLRVWEQATGESAEVPVPPPGGFMALNTLQAVATARKFGAHWAEISSALAQFRSVGMRWAVEDVRGWIAINDGYNANPVSMRAALEAFAKWPVAGRRFLALGPMLELGNMEASAHEALLGDVARGDWAGGVFVSWPQKCYDARTDPFFHAASAEQAAEWLRSRLRPGDALLLKASRGVRIECVLECLKKEG